MSGKYDLISKHPFRESYEMLNKSLETWKNRHFPTKTPQDTNCTLTPETIHGTIQFRGDTRLSLAECVHLHASVIVDDQGGFKEEKLDAVLYMSYLWV